MPLRVLLLIVIVDAGTTAVALVTVDAGMTVVIGMEVVLLLYTAVVGMLLVDATTRVWLLGTAPLVVGAAATIVAFEVQLAEDEEEEEVVSGAAEVVLEKMGRVEVVVWGEGGRRRRRRCRWLWLR